MATTLPAGKYLSIREYANLVGISPSGVYTALSTGRLQGYRIDNTWLINKNAVITSKRNRDGRLIGIAELKNGNIDGFLKKRGLRKEY